MSLNLFNYALVWHRAESFSKKNRASGCAFGMKMHTNARYLEHAEMKELLPRRLKNSIH